MTKPMTKAQEIANKKTQLLLSGAFYRSRMMQSKAVVIQHVQSESIIQSVLKNAFSLLTAKFFSSSKLSNSPSSAKSTDSAGSAGSSNSSDGIGTKWTTYIPMAISVYSFLSRKKLIKPALVVGLFAGVALIQSKDILTWLKSFGDNQTDQ